jgi:hypothetical protein
MVHLSSHLWKCTKYHRVTGRFTPFWLITFERPVFAYMNSPRRTPLEMYFVYLGNKEIYCIFKTCCMITVLFFINHVNGIKAKGLLYLYFSRKLYHLRDLMCLF